MAKSVHVIERTTIRVEVNRIGYASQSFIGSHNVSRFYVLLHLPSRLVDSGLRLFATLTMHCNNIAGQFIPHRARHYLLQNDFVVTSTRAQPA